MENANIRISLDEYGQITGLVSMRTGRNYLSGIPCGFNMTVNISTDDIWESHHGEEISLSSSGVPAEIRIVNNTVIADQVFSLENGTICVTRMITIETDDPLCTLRMRIKNDCASSVVTKVDWLSVKGLMDADDSMQLLWPDKEGELYPDFLASGKHVSASYPSLISMQYVALGNSEESLYYGVHDPDRQFKDFDVDGRYGTLKSTLYPFAASGQTVELPPVVLGLVEGDWHSAANVYRAFLLENGFAKPYGKMASGFCGVASCNLCRYPQKYLSGYTANSARQGGMQEYSAKNLDSYGTPLTIFMGWHEKGFDSMYPDYQFMDAYGGEEAFAQGVEQVHEVGGKALIYINLHIADTASNWYKEHGESCAIRTAYGSVLHESYGTGLDYVAMCPSASAWQNAIVAAVERTRKNGVDGYWFDQLMEMPGNLCYNREHGHTTPATAYAEGYDTLFERINALTAEKDCIYACEGTCDAYLRYIDCCGLMWARQFGSSPQSAPKITRYTLPTLFFGLPTSGAPAGTQRQYSYAWIMGDGMLCRDNNPICKRYAALAARYPQLYATGRYMDTFGLEPMPDGIMAGVLRAREDIKHWAIQLFNTNAEETTFAIKVNATTVCDAESGQLLKLTEEGWQVVIDSNCAISLMVESE